ncbi:MAG: S9 family peptidase [Bryobacteraceae bacterium]|nr:S9 family peptidase [Bryobacteraceae bacterium]
MRFLSILWAFCALAATPTLDELLKLKAISGAQVSPDARWVAYTQGETDFDQNAFLSQVFVTDGSGKNRQLTRARKSSTDPHWSPDSRWIAFLSDREGGKNQIFAISPEGGEAVQLTKSETAVTAFEWSPDGEWIAFVAAAKRPEERKKTLGEFDVVRKEYAYAHLWRVKVADALSAPQAGASLTTGTAYSVGGFDWSPDGQRIAFAAQRNPDLIQGHTSDIYMLSVATKEAKKVVDLPGPDRAPQFSPDGAWIAFSSAMGNAKGFSTINSRVAIVAATGGAVKSLTDAFDENPSIAAWKKDGIYFTASQKTEVHAYRLDPATAKITRLSASSLNGGLSLSGDGQQAAFLTAGAEQLSEVAVTAVAAWKPRVLTQSTSQTSGWTLPNDRVIRWASQDGTMIEGVLSQPKDFDPSRKYPLLCVIHGGPTGVDRPQMVHARYYPIDLWTARGALVLRVNYRGSAGYGEKFRQLNIRNLGVGDAWDVESGVDYLVKQGWVDPQRVGVMGWSQGGYISAFLTTHSTKFKAVSVGAGISNWATYYYNTDITPFTIAYLGANPAADPAIYAKTSPMTKIQSARTPTLIQHGELDRRVPIANAYELRQGLEDRDVPVEMIVYKGFGHGITKPREMRAVLLHNLLWFNHHIFGDPAPDFTLAPKGE